MESELNPRQRVVLSFLKSKEKSLGYPRDRFFLDVAFELRIHDPLPLIRSLIQKGYARYDGPSRRFPQGRYKTQPPAHR